MPLDRTGVLAVFERLGAALSRPTTLCLIGSTPAILSGQDERQTQDIDIWHPASEYDTGELARACQAADVLFDPKGELNPEATYVQIVRPGIVSLPSAFLPEIVARFGVLTVTMPPPAVIAAAKLTRGSERDLEDVAWWMRHRAMDIEDVATAIEELPRPLDRETARENIVFVQLVRGGR